MLLLNREFARAAHSFVNHLSDLCFVWRLEYMYKLNKIVSQCRPLKLGCFEHETTLVPRDLLKNVIQNTFYAFTQDRFQNKTIHRATHFTMRLVLWGDDVASKFFFLRSVCLFRSLCQVILLIENGKNVDRKLEPSDFDPFVDVLKPW